MGKGLRASGSAGFARRLDGGSPGYKGLHSQSPARTVESQVMDRDDIARDTNLGALKALATRTQPDGFRV